MNTQLSTLLDKEVSRKEFLGMSGLAVASVFGLGTIVKLLTGKSFSAHHSMTNAGYGANPYGGFKDSH
ncbi:MAG TPA: hypothetical protein VLG92_00665 [Candidatus Saccharimonadia bacterium]|nr:hypothetical protein [Candidatus Saccharimonadia bacterium]